MEKQKLYKWDDIKVLINGKEIEGIRSVLIKEHEWKLGSSDNNTADLTIELKVEALDHLREIPEVLPKDRIKLHGN